MTHRECPLKKVIAKIMLHLLHLNKQHLTDSTYGINQTGPSCSQSGQHYPPNKSLSNGENIRKTNCIVAQIPWIALPTLNNRDLVYEPKTWLRVLLSRIRHLLDCTTRILTFLHV